MIMEKEKGVDRLKAAYSKSPEINTMTKEQSQYAQI